MNVVDTRFLMRKRIGDLVRRAFGFGPHPAIKWNPYNKVVQDHRDGEIHYARTNAERSYRGLPTPWQPRMGETETYQPPVY